MKESMKGGSAPGERKWEKAIAAGDKSPKAYEGSASGNVRQSKEVGATGHTMKNDSGKKYPGHGPE